MKQLSKKLLNVYLFILYFIVLINIILFFSFSYLILMLIIMLFSYEFTFVSCLFLLLLLLGVLYLISMFYAIIATKKVIQEKPLSKFEKFSSILFPIITIIAYIYLFTNSVLISK